jgi:hypothetical protein
MPFQGYLQDLNWLTGERDYLLSFTDSPTKLTGKTSLGSKNNECQDLSESTLEAMMLLNTDFDKADKADKAEDHSLFPTNSPNASPFDMLHLFPSRINCDGTDLNSMAATTDQSHQSTPLTSHSKLHAQERSRVLTHPAPNHLHDFEEAQGE